MLKIPAALDPAVAAPILCAGVTTYSPLKHWGVKAGDKVGIIGFGGLGEMAVKLAEAMGADVVVFTKTNQKPAGGRGIKGGWRSGRRRGSHERAQGQLRFHAEHGA